MDFLNPSKQSGIAPSIGKLLIAAPLLNDPNFSRSVVLICEHGEEGTMGFVLDRPTTATLGDVIPGVVTPELTVFQGGPVQLDTLHILHRPTLDLGGAEVVPGVFWGGSWEQLQDALTQHTYNPKDIRCLIGYSGWSKDQLAEEMKEGSWVVAHATEKLIFDTPAEELWKVAIATLGAEFNYLVNIPIDPQLN